MSADPALPAPPLLKRLSRYMTLLSFAVGISVLVGWVTGLEFFKRLLPDTVSMNPLSALCFLACSWSLWIQREERSDPLRMRRARWMATSVMLIGAAKLVTLLAGVGFYADTLLFRSHLWDSAGGYINTMSPNAAVAFVFIGLALRWLDREIVGGRRPAQYFGILIMFVAILSLYGYVYGVHYLYGIYNYKPMSLLSALNFLLLALAILFARPDKGTMAVIIGDTSAEITILRLAAFLIPLIMGWLKLKGEEYGYYNTEFGTALFAISTYAIAMFLLARRSVVNYNMRAIKREAQAELQKSHDRFLKFFKQSPEAKLITSADDGRILYMNSAFEELMGFRAETAIGRTTTELGIIRPEDRARTVEGIRETGETKGIELHMKTGKGDMRHMLISLEIIDLEGQSCFLSNYLDITKRKELEDALREREQLLRAILENMGEGVEVVDAEGNFLLVNPMAERLVGRRSGGAATGEWLRQGGLAADGATPDPSEDLALYEALQGRAVDNMEFRVQQEGKDDVRRVRATSRPIRDEEGRVIAGVSVMNDITQRKAMEQQLLHREERLRSIIGTSLDAFIGMNAEGRITDWNPQAEITFGWTHQEIVGKKVSETIMPDRHRDRHRRGLEHFLTTGEGPILNERIETEAWHRHGYEFPIELTISAVQVGDETVFSAFAHDITARREHLEEISRTNSFLNTILENIPNMIFVKDAAELRFVRFNKAGEDLLGYPRESLIGKNDYDFFPKAQADFFTAKDHEVIANRQLVDIPEEPIDTRNGPRWLHTKKITLTDENGQPTYLMGISEDITGSKHLQDALRDRELLLRALVEAMSEGLVVCDPDGKFLLLNAKAGQVLPGSVDGSLQAAVEDLQFFYEDGTTPFPSKEASLVNAIQGRPTPPHDLFLRRKGSEGVYIRSSGLPVRNAAGDVIAGIALFRDVSNLKKLIAAVEAARAALSEMAAAPGAGWIHCQGVSGPVSFGGAAAALLGAELLAVPPEQWFGRNGMAWAEPGTLFLARALNGEHVHHERVEIPAAHSKARHVLAVSAWPVYGSGNTVVAAMAILQEVTAWEALGVQLENVRTLLAGEKERS